jgi:glycosyltransferase involved in cell wall biosynthesis
MPRENTPLLSVIVTAHSEGILIHRTLASVRRALTELSDTSSSEIILHVDNPKAATTEYINTHKHTTLKDVRIFTNQFGDLGASRNFSVNKANGKYVATIDADDLMSSDWLNKAIQYLESTTEPTIAHSEYTIEFEGADSLIVKHGEINYDTDTLLSVYANRWNSVIVAPRKLLLENPYTPNSPGYGYEDWNLNSRFIYAGVHNILIPHTAIFVRRKLSNSEWARQVSSMSVLRANPLLSFKNIRNVHDQFHMAPPLESNPASVARQDAVATAKAFIKKYPFTHRVARRVKRSLKRESIPRTSIESRVPEWLQREWKELHEIDRQIFPTRQLMATIPVYDTLTEEHKLAGSLYKSLVDNLNYDYYEYAIFVPWLTKGGADKYAIEYANTIADLTKKRVLVIATLSNDSPWKNMLHTGVDFLEFGKITRYASKEIRHRLMEHIVENGNIRTLHVINSEFGYDFIRLHENYIKSSGRRVAVTSFSQSIDQESGRLYGYSHTHVPFVYDIADIITSDNQAVLDMWVTEYGFDPKKLFVHRQPIDLDGILLKKSSYTHSSPLRILWAGRIAPEKLPKIAIEIGRRMQNDVTIDMYGTKEAGYEHILHTLPVNVSFRGSYSGFDSLPVSEYYALLYTSLFDGMPNVILESASMGLPIIASSVGGIPEFIINDKTGILVKNISDVDEYCKAIAKYIETDTLGQTYAKNALKQIATHYSREQYKSSVESMLESLGYSL